VNYYQRAGLGGFALCHIPSTVRSALHTQSVSYTCTGKMYELLEVLRWSEMNDSHLEPGRD
jgi:hypothetical protein